MKAENQLFVNNPVCAELAELYSCTDPNNIVSDATVSFSVTDDDGIELPDITWPVTMDWNATDSLYRGVSPVLALVDGNYYRVTIVAKNVLDAVIGEWCYRGRAQSRRP